MSQKIVVGPISGGLKNDVLPFNVDNDSFPTLVNAYQWRGRIKRRRGTSPLGRLQRNVSSLSLGTTDGSGAFSGNVFSPIGLKGNITGATNASPCSITSIAHNLITTNHVLISGVGGMTQLNGATYTVTVTGADTFTIGVDSTLYGVYTSGGIWENTNQVNASVVPSSISITIGGQVFTDNGTGVLSNGAGGTGTINYATGSVTFQTSPPLLTTAITEQFIYYPSLPVMGLEDLQLNTTDDTRTLGFDTVYSYNVPISVPYTPYSVSFYKNPPTGTFAGTSITYTQKSPATVTPALWNGQNYQQFWSTNYQQAFWVTNGIQTPFSATNIGMQYKPCASVTYVSATQLTITITESVASLVVGDWVFINEVTGTNSNTVNFQTGFVSAVSNNTTTTTLTVRFPYAAISNQTYANGILQYLTNNSDATKDCLRWYDGDPTIGISPYTPTPGNGWVNFCPPLISGPTNIFNISDLPPSQYYLVGARMIVPYKDRILFLGPVVQTSSAGSQVYLPDTIIYSQNGVPYYTASWPGAPSPIQTYLPLLTPGWSIANPVSQTAQPSAFWEDEAGYGGFIQAGIQSSITTVGFNEDVLIVGFKNRQTRLIYSGNDIIPFNFYSINTELGSESTFSSVTLDRGVITVGGRGIVITSQTASQRIDLPIPDQIFQFNLTSNGSQRVCAQRDFINEWIYFTYRSNESIATFPNQTLLFNYRNNSWALFNETYTTYGTFRRQTGLTWSTVGDIYPTWESWNDPWDSGVSTLLQPEVIGGNSQGFIMFLGDGTDEANSEYIKSFGALSLVTSPGHSLNEGDYIVISGALGTVGAQVNGKIFSVSNPTQDTFTLSPPIAGGTYLGLGVIQRMYVPMIQTRQFPVSWEMGRKTRIGTQKYLFTTTARGQITLLIYLSQNASSPYNDPFDSNNSLVYTAILYTCPESTNLGLTPANINLQMITASQQNQIWHRMNTSLLGDTVQIGFTLSEEQMRDTSFSNQFSEIELHSFILDVSPSQLLC